MELELEVSRKVRAAIRAKLDEMGCHVDEELTDYIMILVANRRSNQEIESDLSLFLADHTKKFVGWLGLVLKKLEEVTAAEGGSGSKKKSGDAASTTPVIVTSTTEVAEESEQPVSDANNSKGNEDDKIHGKRKIKLERRNDSFGEGAGKQDKAKEEREQRQKEERELEQQRQREKEDDRRRKEKEEREKEERRLKEREERERERRQKEKEEREQRLKEQERRRQQLREKEQQEKEQRQMEKEERERQQRLKEKELRDRKRSSDERDEESCLKSRVSDDVVERVRSRVDRVIRSQDTTSRQRLKSQIVSAEKEESRKDRSKDLHLNSKILLRAVADAQQSIILAEQNSPSALKPKADTGLSEAETRKRVHDDVFPEVEYVPKRRFTDLLEDPSQFYEPAVPSTKRISVKDRLGVKPESRMGVKPELRRSIKERLGIPMGELHAGGIGSELSELYEIAKFNPREDYKIQINVNDQNTAAGNRRNVMLTADNPNRISIQLTASDEEDSSDESNMSQGSVVDSETAPMDEVEQQTVTRTPAKEATGTGPTDDFQLSVSDEDKLPELPNEMEHEEFEYAGSIEEDDKDMDNESSVLDQSQDASQGDEAEYDFSQETMDSQEPNFSITVKNIGHSFGAMKGSNLPDLRSLLYQPNLPMATAPINTPLTPVTNGAYLKCKYWPNCQFKDKCVYEHPKCKFFPCKNKDCVYKHDNPVVESGKMLCKFYPQCTAMNCKFFHPSPCRFGVGCTDGRCENYHPGVTIGARKLKAKGIILLPAVNQLKWVKPE